MLSIADPVYQHTQEPRIRQKHANEYIFQESSKTIQNSHQSEVKAKTSIFRSRLIVTHTFDYTRY